MRFYTTCPLFSVILVLTAFPTFAQLDGLFAPFDCREHAAMFYEEPEQIIQVDSSLLVMEEPVLETFDTINGWKEWSTVENFAFGKDRGALSMITDLKALHPFFRDQIRLLMAECKARGIELRVVETFRTHAKQNEYAGMGRKYTNSTAGRSKHQYGLAVDVVPVVNGNPVWDNPVLWKKVGVIGEKLGLRWGGRWKKPYDPAHFEWTGGLTSYHLAAGELPPIPLDRYPCVDEDMRTLRRYWKEWEVSQSLMSNKGSVAGKRDLSN